MDSTAERQKTLWDKTIINDKKTMNIEIVTYIENKIIPQYEQFDLGHRPDHVRKVIAESMVLARQFDVNEEMVYVIAAYHDLGLAVDRKTHHIISGEMLLADVELLRWFTSEQLELMSEAVVDHRASNKHEPRNIYGCIVAEADRDIVPETVIRRTIQYGLKHYPSETSRAFHLARTKEHIQEKYGENGYLKLHLASAKNQQGLDEIRVLFSDTIAFEQEFNRIFDSL